MRGTYTHSVRGLSEARELTIQKWDKEWKEIALKRLNKYTMITEAIREQEKDLALLELLHKKLK